MIKHNINENMVVFFAKKFPIEMETNMFLMLRQHKL